MLPAVLVERTVFHRSDGVLPLVACLEVSALNDTSTGESQQSRLYVGKSLCHITAKSVFAVLECIDGEETHVLKAYGVCSLEEDAQVCLLLGLGRLQYYLILLPVGRSDVESLLYKFLVLTHRVLVDKLHADGCLALWSLCPYRETIVLALNNSDTEITLVLDTGAAFLMIGCIQHDIVWTTLKWTVVLQFYVTEYLPSHVALWELE